MKVVTKHSGQVRPYGDSVYDFEITSGMSPGEILALCKKYLYNSNNRKDDATHNGSCGFPFGLESFFSFVKIGENKYRYTVTEPYTD